MILGIPKEIKNQEYRVGFVPSAVKELIANGHKVIVQHNAAIGIGFTDECYKAVGAIINHDPEEIFSQSDMIIKVKEPQLNECKMLREGQILFTYLHLAPDPKQTEALKKSGCIAVAYETVTDCFNRLPLLAPMSEIAGRLSIQAGAQALEKKQGGSGVLLGGVPGVPAGTVVIIGAGVVGTNALMMAVGSGAHVIILDNYVPRLRELDLVFGSRITTVYATADNIEKYIAMADLVVGAVLLPGAATPKVLTRNMLKSMKPGSVVVDVSVDQGGCFETTRATTHDDPTYVEENIVHYCVANMPGAVARTSTLALNNATLPFAIALANKGYKKALMDDKHLLNGLNVCKGHITYKAVADALNCEYIPAIDLL